MSVGGLRQRRKVDLSPSLVYPRRAPKVIEWAWWQGLPRSPRLQLLIEARPEFEAELARRAKRGRKA